MIFFILICLPVFAISQKHKDTVVTISNILPQAGGTTMYTGVVTVDYSITKKELFNRAYAWFVTPYNLANYVIQSEDIEAGILIARGGFDEVFNFVPGTSVTVHVSHTIRLYFKNGKYKYEITNLAGEYYSAPGRDSSGGMRDFDISNKGYGSNKQNYNKFLTKVNVEIMATIESLKNTMGKPVITKDF